MPVAASARVRALFRDRDGNVLNTLALDVLDGRIQTIRSVTNRDKLRHVRPARDARAVAREVNQARRPTDRADGATAFQTCPWNVNALPSRRPALSIGLVAVRIGGRRPA
jgi:hypothetical protein